jgi:hypothetical protein
MLSLPGRLEVFHARACGALPGRGRHRPGSAERTGGSGLSASDTNPVGEREFCGGGMGNSRDSGEDFSGNAAYGGATIGKSCRGRPGSGKSDTTK